MIAREASQSVLEPTAIAAETLVAPLKHLDGAKHDAGDLAPLPNTGAHRSRRHFVQFYESDDFLLDQVAAFCRDAIQAGEAAIIVATRPHRDGVAERLRATGLELETALLDGQYVAIDAAETLTSIMDGEMPDPVRFARVVESIMTCAAQGDRHVRVFGEMVALLAIAGNQAAAVSLEELWNDAQRTLDFSLFCAYPMNSLGGESFSQLVNSICLAHAFVIPAESYTCLPTVGARLRAVTALQQKARSLELEVAERRRAEQSLENALTAERAAREEAETALRMRDEFLAAASHELRNPLAILLGRSQFALRRFERDGRIEPRLVIEALEAIAGQVNRLSLLLNRLLDVSRLEAGKLILEPRLAELVTLVERAVSDIRIAQPRHAIEFTAPPSLQAWVDPLRLEQVLCNLLDNATRYSPAGTAVEVDLSQPTVEFVELAVRDHGPGIPVADRDRIFERFYQADGSGFLGGLGLGLYVSKQIVELHGGELRAEFPDDGGSRFSVRIPIEPVRPSSSGDPRGRDGMV